MTIRSVVGASAGIDESRFSILAANPSVTATSFESISTVVVAAGGAANISFTSIPATYQHLQIRVSDKSTNTSGLYGATVMRFNGDSGTNYSTHGIYGTGGSVGPSSSTSDTGIYTSWIIDSATARANMFSAGVIDIIDYANTAKNKTVHIINGLQDNVSQTPVGVRSGMWMNTSAVTSITLAPLSGNFAQFTTASLYGIKA